MLSPHAIDEIESLISPMYLARDKARRAFSSGAVDGSLVAALPPQKVRAARNHPQASAYSLREHHRELASSCNRCDGPRRVIPRLPQHRDERLRRRIFWCAAAVASGEGKHQLPADFRQRQRGCRNRRDLIRLRTGERQAFRDERDPETACDQIEQRSEIGNLKGNASVDA
jgi:hypothetical protein